MQQPFQVIYDDSCSLCRSLAAFGLSRSGQRLRFISWREFRDSPESSKFHSLPESPESVMLWDGLHLQAGSAAWDLILQHHPDLSGLNWLAAKLGLRSPVAKTLNLSSTLLRKVCPSCGLFIPAPRARSP